MHSQGDIVRGRTLRSRMRHCIRREHSRVPHYQRSYRLPTRRHEDFWRFLSFRTITTQPLSSRTSDPLFQNTLIDASCSRTAPARKKVGPSTSESTPSQSNKCLQPTQSLAKRLRSSVAKKSVILISQWEMYFQATDWKGRQFLDLTNNEGAVIAPFYAKGGAWLKYFGRSPSLCARATRLITGSTDSAFSRTNLKPALATTPPSNWESILYTIVPCMTNLGGWSTHPYNLI